MMRVGQWNFTQGKVHRQIEGPDLKEYKLVTKIDPGGRPLTLEILLPIGLSENQVAQELIERATAIGEMFLGTPVRISYDALTPVPGEAVADQHTGSQLRAV
jgi:hypothetical protein